MILICKKIYLDVSSSPGILFKNKDPTVVEVSRNLIISF